MRIIGYDKKKKILRIQYNTKTIWEYSDIQEEDYKHIIESDIPEKELKKLLCRFFIVGVYKGDKNEFS